MVVYLISTQVVVVVYLISTQVVDEGGGFAEHLLVLVEQSPHTHIRTQQLQVTLLLSLRICQEPVPHLKACAIC